MTGIIDPTTEGEARNNGETSEENDENEHGGDLPPRGHKAKRTNSLKEVEGMETEQGRQQLRER